MKASDGGLRPVPFPIDDPERIPVQRYFDEDFYKAENEHLWPHAWQMATRLELIPEVGDWVEYNNVGQSVIVVRASDGIKAFQNACRHRGLPLTGASEFAHGNCSKSGFVCPFHGWRWDMDGENTFVYGKHLFSERQLQEDDLRLVPVRTDVWGNCVFINHDMDAPPLRDCLGPLADNLDAHGIGNLRAEWWYATVLPANWKIAMEAFMEGYHVRTTHPQLQEAIPMLYDGMYANERTEVFKLVDDNLTLRENIDVHLGSMEKLNEGMAGMLHAKEVAIARSLADVEVPDTGDLNTNLMMWLGIVQDQITKQLQAKGEPVPDLNTVCQTHPIKAVEFVFPHYFLLPYFTSMSAYRIRPLGPEECIFEIWSLTSFPEGEEPEPIMEPTFLPYDSKDFPPIPQQDYSNIPMQQKGLHANGFEYMRLGTHIEGLISNYQQLIDGYLAGQPAEKLNQANHKLSANFDGPIFDLGL